ncbi:MAG: signal peptidase I [Syntrophobacteraceae bacterium]|jgi:signal peptidase I
MFDKKTVIKNIETIVIVILFALFIRTFIIQAFNIPSGSMEPTLLPGDFILVNKFIYGIRIPYSHIRLFSYKKPKRGDVIVFVYPKDPSKDFIKRVIGMQRETVQIIHGRIYINGTPVPDSWGYFNKKEPAGFIEEVENFGPVVVPEDSLFVMGDNRNNSEDSRFWGTLPFNNVLGEAFIIYFSWNGKAESLPDKFRWSRIAELIH